MTEQLLSENMLHSALCGMINAVRLNQGFEVSLPQAYATGNVVSVVVAPIPEGYIVHDNSNAAMILERSAVGKPLVLAREAEEGVRQYGCEMDDLRVYRRCKSLDEVALSAVLVGCASRLIADQSLRFERHPLFDFKSRLLGKVRDVLGESRVRVNEPVTGHLGSKYKVSTVILDGAGSVPLAFVEPIADASAVARKFKEFYDLSLSSAYQGVERVAVVDDSKVIPSGDTLLMQEVGKVVRFADAPTMFAQYAVDGR
jgi:hypothetical protein